VIFAEPGALVTAANLLGLLFYDSRGRAVRNMIRRGVPQRPREKFQAQDKCGILAMADRARLKNQNWRVENKPLVRKPIQFAHRTTAIVKGSSLIL